MSRVKISRCSDKPDASRPGVRHIEIAPMDTDELLIVRLSGKEWVRPADLAPVYGVCKRRIIELCDLIAETHQMRVRNLGDRSIVINLADFRRGLISVAPVRQGYTEKQEL